MADDIASTLKWWVEHANELEKDRDRWKMAAVAYRQANNGHMTIKEADNTFLRAQETGNNG